MLFGAFAFNLETHGPLLQTDLIVATRLHTLALHTSPIIIALFVFGSFLGREMIVLIGLGLALIFLYKRFWRELTMVIIAFLGEELLFESLSRLFNRHRPVFAQPIADTITVPGFPSGHTMSAIVCYGLLAYLLLPHLKTPLTKALLIAFTLFIILFIGFSRVYLGDHYLTDVLAGYSLGLAWAVLAYAMTERLFPKNAA